VDPPEEFPFPCPPFGALLGFALLGFDWSDFAWLDFA
jgi:hypothetical protein